MFPVIISSQVRLRSERSSKILQSSRERTASSLLLLLLQRMYGRSSCLHKDYPFPAYSVHRTAAQGRFYLIIITMHSERPRVRLHDRTFELAVPHREIIGKIEALAARINADYGDGSRGIPLFVGVLNGAFMFFAELLQRISFPCEVSFVRLSSYHGTTSTGSVTEVFGLRENIEAAM